MVFIWIGGPQLGVDIGSAGLALLTLIATAVCGGAIVRRKRSMAAIASIAIVLGSVYFVYRTLVTPSGSWPVMYAAVLETTGAQRRERINELLSLWNHGQVRQVDWYFLSRRWNVCHRMWQEEGCRMPAGQLVAEGFVREDIHALAKDVK